MINIKNIKAKKVLEKQIEILKSHSEEVAVLMIVNIKGITHNQKDYASHSVSIEYFTEPELKDLLSAFHKYGIYVDISTEESEFIKKTLSGFYHSLPYKYSDFSFGLFV